MKPHVLVVDDEKPMCDLLEVGLGKRFDVVSRTSALEALEVIRNEPLDVVVADLRMAGMQGTELCRRALEIQPDLPVILITSFGSLESAIEAIRVGAYDFVTKPFQMETIARAIERAAQNRALKDEVRRLRVAVSSSGAVRQLLGTSSAMSRVRDLIARVATSEASVLVSGESGTGKEVTARAIHDASDRMGGPFVAINCAAISESLLESELFGHTKGAFTDAKGTHQGLFVQAHGGTLFLDEIGDMPVALQPKLLRALQERTVRPVGGSSEIAFDVRVISATNQDLEHAVATKEFREDLFYRLNVVEVAMPPLRARGEDVLVLAQHFLDRFAQASGKQVRGFSAAVGEALLGYGWPGNVRELANCLERAVALTRFEELVVDDLPERARSARRSLEPVSSGAESDIVPLEEIERRYILHVLATVGQSRGAAAQLLGIDRKTLYRKLGRYGGH